MGGLEVITGLKRTNRVGGSLSFFTGEMLLIQTPEGGRHQRKKRMEKIFGGRGDYQT